MKKLLISLTILALISPIGQTVANAEGTDSTHEPATTNVSVDIEYTEDPMTFEVNGDFKFEHITLSFDGTSEPVGPTEQNSSTMLKVTDPRFNAKGYVVTATFNGYGNQPFPEETYLTLKSETPVGDKNNVTGVSKPQKNEGKFILTVGEELPVLWADRETSGEEYQGAGTWNIEYTAEELKVGPIKQIYNPKNGLSGNITWTLKIAGN